MVANVNRGSSSDKMWEPADFFPALRPPPETLTDEQIARKLESLWA